MFRIDVVFKKSEIRLCKISGEIRYADLIAWREALQTLEPKSNETLILDLCEVAYLSPEAGDQLIHHLTADIFVYNGSASIRNMLRAAGVPVRMLG